MASLKYHIQLQHSERIPTREISGSDENTIMPLLCPFECGVEPFKTQNDQREHLMKEHSCTDNLKQLTPTVQSSSTNDGIERAMYHTQMTFLMKEKLKKKITSGKHTYQTHKV